MDTTSQNSHSDSDLIHQFSFDSAETDSIVVAVSLAVSEVTGTPMEKMPPLQGTLDCDALESLFDSFDVDDIPGIGTVQFPFHGCTVRIDTTGMVQVYDDTPRLGAGGTRC